MKKVISHIAFAVLLTLHAQGAEVTFPRADVALTAPDDWTYVEDGQKAFLSNPDKTGKIQVFVTHLPKGEVKNGAQAYYDTVFKGASSPRPGQPVVLLEKGDFETASGLHGVKGAFGYAQGKNGGPEVWTWRYFFPRPDGQIVSLCSFVYGDEERAKAQEAIIAESLRLLP
jgi:hypothetical protein